MEQVEKISFCCYGIIVGRQDFKTLGLPDNFTQRELDALVYENNYLDICLPTFDDLAPLLIYEVDSRRSIAPWFHQINSLTFRSRSAWYDNLRDWARKKGVRVRDPHWMICSGIEEAREW